VDVQGDQQVSQLLKHTDQEYQPTSKKKTRLSLLEEREGTIEFQVIANDKKAQSMIILTGLKNIFQKQLPKMPKEYIARLVYDRNHFSMAVVRKEPLKVLGGITYRPFANRKFAEIVFCAIDSSEQVKGYGSRLMSHVKDYVRHAHDVHYFLTYADNYAIGYFKKQGFTTEITLEKSIWVGYIKDYEGGTIMQCSMIPKVAYLDAYELIMAQRKAVFDKIYQVTQSNEVHPGITSISPGNPMEPENIPGLIEAGYTKNLRGISQIKPKSPIYTLLKKLVAEAQSHSQAWPFLVPVAGVPDYYEVIKEPMDLKTLDEKVEADSYATIALFEADLAKIFQNCKFYNEAGSTYHKCATKLEKFCKEKMYQLRKENNI